MVISSVEVWTVFLLSCSGAKGHYACFKLAQTANTECLKMLNKMYSGISCELWKRSSVGRVSLARGPVCGLPLAVQRTHTVHKPRTSAFPLKDRG